MHKILYLTTLLALFIPQDLHAKIEFTDADSGYEKIIMPELFATSVLIDNNDEKPIEPNISEVSFLRLEPVSGFGERVDRLIHGVKKDIPPEFDHFGYEIRRYMAHVGNIKIFEDEEFIKQQIKNIRKAKVIADFWKTHLSDEVREIEKIMEEDQNISFTVRTAFKQNKTTIRTFIISLKGWIDTNERLLMGVFNNEPDIFELLYPEIIVNASQERLDLYNNVNARQTKLKEIVKYQPFAMMVY